MSYVEYTGIPVELSATQRDPALREREDFDPSSRAYQVFESNPYLSRRNGTICNGAGTDVDFI